MTRKRKRSLFSFDDIEDDDCALLVREEQTTFGLHRSRKRISLATSSIPNIAVAESSNTRLPTKTPFLSTVLCAVPDACTFSSTHEKINVLDTNSDISSDEDIEDEDEDEDLTETEVLADPESKRKRYKSLDDFRELKEEFLQQLFSIHYPDDDIQTCTSCGKIGASITCLDCFHYLIRCQKCIVKEHIHMPLHRLQYFDGGMWHRTTLCALGLVVYLGHKGEVCPALHSSKQSSGQIVKIVVLDVTGIQEVNVAYCKCDLLVGVDAVERSQLLRHKWFPATTEHPGTVTTFSTLDIFEALSGEGKTSGYHFYKSLLRLSNGFGYRHIPKRYEEFMRMTREYQHLKLIQRAGKLFGANGHLTVNDTDLAVDCPACPHPRKNIPSDWEKRIDSWIYSLYMMIDANFRLKLKKKRSPDDLDLGGGLSYFVRGKPYKEFLKKAVEEKEARLIKYCESGLRAVDHARLKGGKGYEASGVVGVQCRHMLIRPNGMGDLQKGEKYANVDYVVLSSLKNLDLKRVVMSYDIVCQYSRNFVKRMANFEKAMQLDLSKVSLDFVIPQFHIFGHGESCRTRYNLRFHQHVGRTDGENIERGWAFLNPLSMASKEMGPGARCDYLDWHIGDWNFQRILNFGSLFSRKLLEASGEGVKHSGVVDELRRNLPKGMVNDIEARMRKWNDNKENPNPYAEEVHGTSMLRIRRELHEAEANDYAGGSLTSGNASLTHWLIVGLEIEDSQISIRKLFKKNKMGKVTATSTSASEKNLTAFRNLCAWKKMQVVHMPQLPEHDIWDPVPEGKRSLHCWTVKLNLPSSINHELRHILCPNALADKEFRLRTAQAQDSLDEIRHLLQKQWWLTSKKRQHVSGPGVKINTQSSCAIQSLRERRDVEVNRYRRARVAMEALKPGGSWQNQFRVLRDEDIRPMEDDEGKGEGRRTLSWIWIVKNVISTCSDDDIYNGLKVEYAKARARAQRWLEETTLLREEMRRVLCFFNWKGGWWLEQVSDLKACKDVVAQGSIVYANKQAWILQQLALYFRQQWAADCNIKDLPEIENHERIVIKEIAEIPCFEDAAPSEVTVE